MAEALGGSGRKVLIGFVAGALAVLVFHQLTIFVLGLLKVIPAGNAWSFRLNPWKVPVLINAMFWGGLWGCLYAVVRDRLPSPAWLGGFVFGVLGPALIGGWIIMPLIRGIPLFAGLAPLRLIIGAIINGMFGLGLALFYGPLARRL